jgi:uncharacterized protein YoxC
MPHSEVIEQRLRFLQLVEEENFETLRDVQLLVQAGIDGMLDVFYDHILKQPELEGLFSDERSLERARKAQKSHWMRILFARKYGEKQFEQMKRVGEAHVKVGLGPSWYLSAYCLMLNQITDLIVEQEKNDPATMKRVIRALNKAVILDISFVIDSYIEAKNATMKEILVRATRFTEDVQGKVENLTQTADDLKAYGEALDGASTAELAEISGRLSRQVADLNERLSQLMYGDRLLFVENEPVSFLTRVKQLIGKRT